MKTGGSLLSEKIGEEKRIIRLAVAAKL